jgi:hypothetical protein
MHFVRRTLREFGLPGASRLESDPPSHNRAFEAWNEPADPVDSDSRRREISCPESDWKVFERPAEGWSELENPRRG